MKVVFGLGNPGPEYDATRHNVGWWVLDRVAYDLDFPTFVREGPAWTTRGRVGSIPILLVKPATYMNRSGRALSVLADSACDVSSDLLVVVDDAARAVGRVRFRASGSAGGHNGLKSISGALGGTEFPRLRIGVGRPPDGVEMSDWVLGEFAEDEERTIVDALPELSRAVVDWATLDFDEVMDRYNR